ncbi:hypothetical protein E4T44_03352 [Aureobasidium sp. EXF-8845]|nr:hypothetical protein E4T44_03352 [Aureobasidium sp. EXF-8845]
MKIPTFFLRTNMRLWIFQALVAWFCIRSHYLPIPSLMRFALTSTLWTYVDDAKEILDSRFRFILPTEAAYFLPVALEAYLVGSMPELAILLGTSPCDDRITPKDPVTRLCAPDIAYHCYNYADMYSYKSSKGSLRVMQGCWELYHTDVEDARKHHERAHKHEPSFFLQLVGYFWEKNTEICGANPSVVQCIAEYGGSVTKDDKTGRPMALEASEEVAGGSDIEAAAAS